MPDAFLEAGQHRLLVAGVDVDDPVGSEADLGQGRREQVLPGDAPEDLAFRPGGDARCEQRRSSPVDRGVAAAGDVVQRPERQPAAGEGAINGGDAERQNRPGAQRRPLEPLDLLAETTDGRRWDDSTHTLKLAGSLFMICSNGYRRESIGQSGTSARFRYLRPGSHCESARNLGIYLLYSRRNETIW